LLLGFFVAQLCSSQFRSSGSPHNSSSVFLADTPIVLGCKEPSYFGPKQVDGHQLCSLATLERQTLLKLLWASPTATFVKDWTGHSGFPLPQSLIRPSARGQRTERLANGTQVICNSEKGLVLLPVPHDPQSRY